MAIVCIATLALLKCELVFLTWGTVYIIMNYWTGFSTTIHVNPYGSSEKVAPMPLSPLSACSNSRLNPQVAWTIEAFSTSAWKSGPVPVFYHFGGGLQPDRSSIKGNSQKTGPKPKKTAKNRSEPVRTGLHEHRSPDLLKLVITLFSHIPLLIADETHKKSRKLVQNRVRYHQNRVWTQVCAFKTRFWWYLAQFLTNLRDFLCVSLAIGRGMWLCVGSAKTGHNRSCWTGFFAVFESKKWQDQTDGPVFSGPGPVHFRSFSGPIDRTLKH